MDEITIPDDLSGLSGDELRALLKEINDAGKAIAAQAREAEGEDRDELIKTLNELKEQKARVTTAIEETEAAEAEAEEAINDAESAFDEEDEESDDSETDDAEADAEVDADAEADAEAEGAEAEAEPVAASRKAKKGGTFNVPRRREIPQEKDEPGNAGATFRSGGQTIETLEALMRQFQNAERMAGRNKNGRSIMASFNRLPDGTEVVRGDRSAWDNTRIALRAGLSSDDVLTAAGGFCGPAESVTDVFECGRTDRPIGDLLAKFTARGEYRYIRQVGLDDVDAGIDYWTEADDVAVDPENVATHKPCYHLACESEIEAKVIMIPACFQYGVGQAWSNPEQVAGALAKFDVALARRSEALIWQRIHEQSNQLTFAPPVGESLQNGLVRLIGELLAWAGFNGRNSLDGYVLVVPEALILQVITDAAIKAWVGPQLTREMIVGQLEELYGVPVIISPDNRALAPSPPIGPLPAAPAPAGGPNEKPSTWQEILLFKPADYRHGLTEVDVAVQTDIATARKNDRSVFLETVETTEKFGCSPSFSVLYNCLNPTGAQPDLVAADATYNACPQPATWTFPGATI